MKTDVGTLVVVDMHGDFGARLQPFARGKLDAFDVRPNDVVSGAGGQALGELAPHIPVGAIKSLTGHSIGAAGAIEALATVLALDAGSLPHTAGIGQVDPTLDLDIITGEPRPMVPGKDLALSNSLAFGGLNAVLAIRRFAN